MNVISNILRWLKGVAVGERGLLDGCFTIPGQPPSTNYLTKFRPDPIWKEEIIELGLAVRQLSEDVDELKEMMKWRTSNN